jgi:uncharacterized protein involved in exopolysaccharide biosynthesis
MMESEPQAAPTVEEADAGEELESRELLLMLAVLAGLLVVAAIVFLLVPTSWIGARVEVIIHQ